MRKKIFLFDFDGTITSADTLLCFIRYACGLPRFIVGFALFSPLIVLMKLGLYPNYLAKQRLFSWYFRGMALADFDAVCRRFASDNSHLMRVAALDKLRGAFADGDTVVVVSASVDNRVRPFFDTLRKESDSSFFVLGTQVATDSNGRLTGRFLTPNCYGPEKVNRLLAQFPSLARHREDYELIAFGDSRGDREMLAFADEAQYKPFRNGGNGRRQRLGEIVRFGIVGATATVIQYGVYLLLLRWLAPGVANTIGYALSFAFNFVASTRYTFRVEASAKHGAGFALSHAVNYVLQMVMLNLAIWIGVPDKWAPVPMFCVCVPVNFVLVRFFLKR